VGNITVLLVRLLAIICVMNFGMAVNAYFKADTFSLATHAISCLGAIGFLFVLTEKRR
jgi:hypothetical protein